MTTAIAPVDDTIANDDYRFAAEALLLTASMCGSAFALVVGLVCVYQTPRLVAEMMKRGLDTEKDKAYTKAALLGAVDAYINDIFIIWCRRIARHALKFSFGFYVADATLPPVGVARPHHSQVVHRCTHSAHGGFLLCLLHEIILRQPRVAETAGLYVRFCN